LQIGGTGPGCVVPEQLRAAGLNLGQPPTISHRPKVYTA